MSDYVTAKTNWLAGEIPVPSDFNRIEGNTKANHDAIIEEVDDRDAAILVETNARVAADALKQNLPSNSSDYNMTDFPVGTCLFVESETRYGRNQTLTPLTSATNAYQWTTAATTGSVAMLGTWRVRGVMYIDMHETWMILAQRTA